MELVEPSVTHAALWPLSVPGVINQLHLKQLTEFWPPERDQLVNRYRMMAMRAVVNLSLTPHVYSDWFCSCSFRFLFYESKSCLSIRSFSSKFQMCNCWGRNIGHNYIVQKKTSKLCLKAKKRKSPNITSIFVLFSVQKMLILFKFYCFWYQSSFSLPLM